jgi:predicted unusual protein kinase regulating ubiquinone biosynthesis (AarF/ABC1/UbiB family)
MPLPPDADNASDVPAPAASGSTLEPVDDRGTLPSRPDSAPSSRFGRLARLTALAPKVLPFAVEGVRRAINTRPGQRERTEDEERESRAKMLSTAKKTAEAMLKTLGEMKGLPLKFGQMASYIDGLAPPGYEDKFQEVLKRLQAKAPPVSREAAVQVVKSELGGAPETIFASFDLDPFAAASVGQVHRATTKGGDVVAVKVQYPGIDKAIENDLKSLSMLETMFAPVGRRYHSKETLEEVRAVFMAELDYGQEAETSETFRRIHADDDQIVIPRVHHSLTTRRVLTLELIGGQDYATFVKTASQEEKNAAGATLFRFMFRPLHLHGLMYADPHPGNYRFLGGGKVGFLDFGCVKQLPPHLATAMSSYIRAAQKEDWDAFYRACHEVLGFDESDRDGWRLYTEYVKTVLEPLRYDRPFKYTQQYAREAVAYLVRGGREMVFKDDDPLPNLPKPIHMPSDLTFVNRLQWGFASVMGGLEAEANFFRIVDPWLDVAVTPPPT